MMMDDGWTLDGLHSGGNEWMAVKELYIYIVFELFSVWVLVRWKRRRRRVGQMADCGMKRHEVFLYSFKFY